MSLALIAALSLRLNNTVAVAFPLGGPIQPAIALVVEDAPEPVQQP